MKDHDAGNSSKPSKWYGFATFFLFFFGLFLNSGIDIGILKICKIK